MTLASIRERARKRPEQEFFINRLYGAHLSPYFTWLCFRAGLSPDQVTLIGGGMGLAGVSLLFLPLGWWSLLAVVLLQVGYVLDFSDGQVARLTGHTSNAGAYLDWLTHFYVPVGAALAIGASAAWASGAFALLILAAVAAVELSAFTFSAKEHVLISMQRNDPSLAQGERFRAALWDDARADSQPAAPASPSGIPGRRGTRSLLGIAGELLIYPGAIHLATLAILFDVAVGSANNFASARAALLVLWAGAGVAHIALAARRNHALIRLVERDQRGGR